MKHTRGIFSGGVVDRAMDMSTVPPLGRVAIVYLAVLPLGQMGVIPIGGAMATVSDFMLGALLVLGMVSVLGSVLAPDNQPLPRLNRPAAAGFVLLGLFGAWIGLSGLWGFHPVYATAKSTGIVALAAGAYLIAVAGVRPRVLVDAWLLGAMGVVVATVVLLATGLLPGSGLEWRVLYGGGGVLGLPIPRVRGPFVHPNLFGEYLVVTLTLLWARWPDLMRGGAWVWKGLTVMFGGLLVWTVSSGWLAAGVVLVGLALSRRHGGTAVRRALLGVVGVLLAGVSLVGAVRPLELRLGPFEMATGGIRAEIWADAMEAFRAAPAVGVGAAPYLAETGDPFAPGTGTALWDAHSAYLSVAGQFGVVGLVLFFGGILLVGRGVVGVRRRPVGGTAAGMEGVAEVEPSPGLAEGVDVEAQETAAADHATHDRLPFALLLIAAALLVHWVTIAGEDFRHAWAVVGVAGAVVVWGRARRATGEESAAG